MIALYRKYRPTNFAEVIGQELITQPLTNSIRHQRVHHAYLFAGPRGSGKTSIAKIFAKSLNCLNPTNGDACNECANCQAINAGKASDVVEIDGASNNGVEEVRNIIDRLRFFPAISKRVFIIDEAHMLSNAAWNAFLKTLEEPTNDVVFIFTTTEPTKIPVTVLSRCQRFQFRQLSNLELSKLLDRVLNAESIKISQSAKSKLISLSDGSARDCLALLDQLNSFGESEISETLIDRLFGLVSKETKFRFIQLLQDKQLEAAVALINEMLDDGLNGSIFCQDLVGIMLDCLMYSRTEKNSYLQQIDQADVEKLNLTETQITTWIPIIAMTDAQIKKYAQPKFYLEMMVFDLLQKKC